MAENVRNTATENTVAMEEKKGFIANMKELPSKHPVITKTVKTIWKGVEAGSVLFTVVCFGLAMHDRSNTCPDATPNVILPVPKNIDE